MIFHDFRFALRLIRRQFRFHSFVILTLGIAIGGSVAIFSLFFGLVLAPLAYSDSSELVRIWQTSPDWEKTRNDRLPVSYPNFQDWRTLNRTFEDLAAYWPRTHVLTVEDRGLEVEGALVTQNFFPLMKIAVQAGRPFAPDDYATSEPTSLVIGHGLSRRLFGASTEAIGRSIQVGDRNMTVVGVLPSDFQWWFTATSGQALKWASTDLWIPYVPPTRLFRQAASLQVVGRLKPGHSLDQAREEMTAIGEQLKKLYPTTNGGIAVDSLQAHVTGPYRSSFELLMAAAALILATTISNLAGLLLGRALERRREVAVRLVTGATLGRVARQFLVESLVVAGLAGLAGLALAAWFLSLLKPLIPGDVPRIAEVAVDPAAFGFALAVAAGAGVLLGLSPLARIGFNRFGEQLRDNLARYAPRRRSRFLALLVAGEIGCTLALLAASGLALGSFLNLRSVDLGMNQEDLFFSRLLLPESKYATPQQQSEAVASVLTRLKTLNGGGICAAARAPFSNWTTTSIVPEAPGASADSPPSARVNIVTPGYFQVLGIPLLAGRDFDAGDDLGDDPVAIVNQSLAEKDFLGLDPVGRKLKLHGKWVRIVGVASSARQQSLTDEIPREVFLPMSQRGLVRMTLIARLRPDGRAAERMIREIRSVEPEALVGEALPLGKLVEGIFSGPRIRMAVFGFLAAMACLVSFVGMFGIVSNAVAGRRHEFGIRMSLGATAAVLKREALIGNLPTICVGIVLGLVLFAAVGKLLESQLFGLSPTNPTVLGATVAAVFAIALLATYLPTRQIDGLDPVETLRRD